MRAVIKTCHKIQCGTLYFPSCLDLLESEESQNDFIEMSPIKRPVTSTCATATLSSQAESDHVVRPSTSTEDNEGPSGDPTNDCHENGISQPIEQSSPSTLRTVETDSPRADEANKAASPARSNRWPVIEAKKSKLYTLNPFAISVRYLRPQKKQSNPRNTESEIPSSSSTPELNSGIQSDTICGKFQN